MPTPAERRALLFLAALAALGVTARGITALKRAGANSSVDVAALDRQIAAVDSAVASTRGRGKAPRKATGEGRGASVRAEPPSPVADGAARSADNPLALYEARRLAVEESNREARARAAGPPPATGRGLTVDLDVAGADAIAGLPWIGEALAARIVTERTARGPFGSLEGLQRVRGIGPAVAARIAPYVTFSRSTFAQPHNPPARSRRGRGFRP